MSRLSLRPASIGGGAALLLALTHIATADLSVVTSAADGGPDEGGVAAANPPPPPCAPISLEQNQWTAPGFVGVGCNLFLLDGSAAIGLARAFEMPSFAGFEVHCVNAVIATNSSPFTAIANIWLGTPGTPTSELALLASQTIEIPEISFSGGQISISFVDGDIAPLIPAGSTAIIEIGVPSRSIAEGGPGGQSTIMCNPGSATGPTYVRAIACGIPDFADLADFIENFQVRMRVDGLWVAAPECLGDFDGNGLIDGADMGLLLGQWGQPGFTDLDGDGTTDGADLGILLGSWGSCTG
ncbi:MAG TPA: hypothetical protein PKC43_11510 [Phycisphaerales bacterium]|nr:hypothetical protein [Phycisphaerales bacterium]HMP38059.1 hypothetical protein [Phycisphaerales bacterium]